MHREILSPDQRRILPALVQVTAGTNFYLAGGTALALRIGHRPSVDFDWFAPSIGDPEQILRSLTAQDLAPTVVSTGPETFYVLIETVQVSFIGYDYPLLEPIERADTTSPPLAGIADIAAMKLSAIANRGARKDFIDLFFIIRDHIPLQRCLELFQRKYAQRDIGHIVRSLLYFADADQEPPVAINTPISWNAIKKSLEQETLRLIRTSAPFPRDAS